MIMRTVQRCKCNRWGLDWYVPAKPDEPIEIEERVLLRHRSTYDLALALARTEIIEARDN